MVICVAAITRSGGGHPASGSVCRGGQRVARLRMNYHLRRGLVMIVFLGFAAGDSLGIEEMGLALPIAVAVDATVGCLLVPATMTLLGNANWWAPTPLHHLGRRFGVREAPPATGSGIPQRGPDLTT